MSVSSPGPRALRAGRYGARSALQFGAYDLSGQTPRGRLIADEYFIEAEAGEAPDRTHPGFSPIYADPTDPPWG